MPSTTSNGSNVLTYPASGATGWNSTLVTLFQNVTDYIDNLDLTISSGSLSQAAGHLLEITDIDVVTGGAINWESGSSLIVESGATFQTSAALVSPSSVNLVLTPGSGAALVLDGLSWPTADGTNGQVLQTNGSGTISFASITTDIVGDTTPQLGGNLDVQSYAITSSSTNDIYLHSNDDILLELGDASGSKKVSVRDSASSEVASIDSDGDLVCASLDLGDSGAVVTKIADEDDMTSDSATMLATQQSIKAYVDAAVAAASYGWELLSASSASGATDITVSLTSGYKVYKVFIPDLTINTDGEQLIAQLQTSGGSYRTGASDYSYRYDNYVIDGTTSTADDATNSEIPLTLSGVSGLGSDTNESASLELTIHSPRSSSIYTRVEFAVIYIGSTGVIRQHLGFGTVKTAEDNDELRIRVDGVVTLTGSVRVLGLKES